MFASQNVKNQHEEAIINRQGVVGVGVGVKWVDGKPTHDEAIIVFVEKKRTKRNIFSKFSVDDVVPHTIDGVPTDVIEVGKVVKHGFTNRVRPIKPGYSGSHKKVTAGTIGGFFIDRDGDHVALSNCHVFADENRAALGDLIFQPGSIDAKGKMDFSGWKHPVGDLPCFGTLKKYVKLQEKDNLQDSAIAKINPMFVNGSMIDHYYPQVNKVLAGFRDPEINMNVQKLGRTTGYTSGRIIGLHTSFTVGYDFGNATFNDCIVTTGLSAGGDSGSLILDMGMNAVGLLFAGSKKVTLANPIKYPRDEYGLQLWNGGDPNDVLDFGDNTWKYVAGGGASIQKDGAKFKINCPAHQYAFVENPITDFQSITVKVNTGSDMGATWGPGLVVQWPTGMVKVNLRYGHCFGGYYNTNESLVVGSTKPNTEYTLRITKGHDVITGEILDNGKWYTAIQISSSLFPMPPSIVKVGKTCPIGSSNSHSTVGDSGECTLSDFIIK